MRTVIRYNSDLRLRQRGHHRRPAAQHARRLDKRMDTYRQVAVVAFAVALLVTLVGLAVTY